MSHFVVNLIPGIENKSYLELGVGTGRNFQQVRAKDKTSVDINGRGTITCTTDLFYLSIPSTFRWDVIFIDANHDFDFVLRDYNHSIKHCTEWILLHDMIPPNRRYTESRLCSDSYKLLFYLLTSTRADVYPMGENYGLTLVRMPAEVIQPPESLRSLSYEEFMGVIRTMRLYTRSEMAIILGKASTEKEKAQL